MKLTSPTSLCPTLFGELLVKPKDHPRGQAYLSAASGLVRVGKRWYVIADDELHVGVFEERLRNVTKTRRLKKGKLVRLLGGTMPDDVKGRKAAKPDFESLVLLPAFRSSSAGALLALGSGSRPNRQIGVMIELDPDGGLDQHRVPSDSIGQVDLTPLYASLRKHFSDLNIEGAFVSEDSTEFILLHRGNQGDARSACIRYDWPLLQQWLIRQTEGASKKQAPPATSVQIIQPGSVNGVALSLTDGAALAGGSWAFCAVAEATMDSVQDGACVGAAVGVINRSGEVIYLRTLRGNPKVEGICVEPKNANLEVTLVTDPDNPDFASQMFKVTLEGLPANEAAASLGD